MDLINSRGTPFLAEQNPSPTGFYINLRCRFLPIVWFIPILSLLAKCVNDATNIRLPPFPKLSTCVDIIVLTQSCMVMYRHLFSFGGT